MPEENSVGTLCREKEYTFRRTEMMGWKFLLFRLHTAMQRTCCVLKGSADKMQREHRKGRLLSKINPKLTLKKG